MDSREPLRAWPRVVPGRLRRRVCGGGEGGRAGREAAGVGRETAQEGGEGRHVGGEMNQCTVRGGGVRVQRGVVMMIGRCAGALPRKGGGG